MRLIPRVLRNKPTILFWMFRCVSGVCVCVCVGCRDDRRSCVDYCQRSVVKCNAGDGSEHIERLCCFGLFLFVVCWVAPFFCLFPVMFLCSQGLRAIVPSVFCCFVLWRFLFVVCTFAHTNRFAIEPHVCVGVLLLCSSSRFVYDALIICSQTPTHIFIYNYPNTPTQTHFACSVIVIGKCFFLHFVDGLFLRNNFKLIKYIVTQPFANQLTPTHATVRVCVCMFFRHILYK